MSRKEYTKQFKEEAVRLSYEVGGAQASRQLGLSQNLIYRWRKERKESPEEAFRGKGKMKAEQAEIARLKRQLADAKEENEILKKAITIFSKPR